MPSVHSYEMIRAGMFGSRIETFYSMPYLSSILAVMTLIGLWLVKDVRQYLEFE
jgi:capsular polysaccharide transport system permease protein